MPSVAGIGIDLCRVERFRTFLREGKTRVVDRLFTEGEKVYSLPKKDPAPHLAARFAAKEAFLKALGLGLRDGIAWHDMDVVRDELGAPSIKISGKAAEVLRERSIGRIHLSYSHDGEYAVANVVLEGP